MSMDRREFVIGGVSAVALKALSGCVNTAPEDVMRDKSMIFRISEVEVYPQFAEDYLPFAAEVAMSSVANEPGVVSIFPMRDKKDPCFFRIVEIYADEEAYKEHIASAHFKRYKAGTLHMVKNLALLDHEPLVPELRDIVFRKPGI